jgi:hypothetical protein
MGQDKEQHFLSLSRILFATILGGAAGFLLIVWDSEDTASKTFLLSDGFPCLVQMVTQFAVWGLVFVLIWKKTLWLLGDAFMHHKRLWAIWSLALYLAVYWLLLWFPKQLIKGFSGHELESNVPVAHYSLKSTIFSAVQFVFVLLPVAGIWLADWRIRNKIASNGSEEECFSALLDTRRYLLKLGAVLTTLVALSFLGLVLWGEALKPYVAFLWFDRPPLLIYGLYLTVLVAIPYLPAYLNLLVAGREVRDRFYPRLLPGAPDYEERDAHRRRVDELLRLQVRVRESLKILATILVPVATSLVYALLGLKQ